MVKSLLVILLNVQQRIILLMILMSYVQDSHANLLAYLENKRVLRTHVPYFFDICEIISEKQPKVVFLENVKHLVHHDGGNTLKTILSKLEELGYKVSWKVLNGADFGIPQNRERIIIIGSKDRLFDFEQLSTQPKRPLADNPKR